MNQRDIYAFITPEELASIIEEATKDRTPNIIGQSRGVLEYCKRSILGEFYEKRFWRFYLGFGERTVDNLQGSPWNRGYIQFDNPIWSETALREVHIVIMKNYEPTEEFIETSKVFNEIVKEIKKISTRGKYLTLIWQDKLDTRNWLSLGARQWMKEGKQVTDSAGTSDGKEPHIIHKLILD